MQLVVGKVVTNNHCIQTLDPILAMIRVSEPTPPPELRSSSMRDPWPRPSDVPTQ